MATVAAAFTCVAGGEATRDVSERVWSALAAGIVESACERLTEAEGERLLYQQLRDADGAAERAARLNELRRLYEPFIEGLATYFQFRVPRYFPERTKPDNWQTSAWTKRAPGITELPAGPAPDEHFG